MTKEQIEKVGIESILIDAQNIVYKQHDPVNKPLHYTKHLSGIECIEITRRMNFNKGNAIKYIWRAEDKGNEIQDLQKAKWYIEDEIKRLNNIPLSAINT